MSLYERTTAPHTSRNTTQERTRTMGASRDFTTGTDTGAATTLLEPGRRAVPQRTPRQMPHRTQVPARRGNRLGSKQVVSFRGRRLPQQSLNKKSSLFTRMSFMAIGLLIFGVVVSMWLSGISTAQTFVVKDLTVRESELNNQLETLNRDLENVRSASDVARRANDAKMGVPTQPGIVEVGPDGAVNEKRPAELNTESIVDVNGEPVRPGQASSDPNATKDISDSLNEVPQGRQREARNNNGQAPAGQESAAAAPQDLPNIPAQAPYAN